MRIAFSGRQRSGKTVAAEYLAYEFSGVVMSFATPLKMEIYDALENGKNLHDFVLYSPNATVASDCIPNGLKPPTGLSRPEALAWIDEHKLELREMMQIWGDWRRSQDSDYFIKKMCSLIDGMDEGVDIFVDDARFHNECNELEKRGFTIIRVQSGDEERKKRGAANEEHPSETELDGRLFKYVVHNNREKHNLYRQLDEIIKEKP